MLSQAIYLYYNIIIMQSGEPLSKKQELFVSNHISVTYRIAYSFLI